MRRLDRFRNRHGKIWLNVASSTDALEDFVNIDNHVFLWLSRLPPALTRPFPQRYRCQIAAFREAARVGPMARHDCRKPLPLPEASADHILCSHFLEHIYPDECCMVLADFHRVLKPGATLHVIVPDLAAQVEAYARRRQAGEAGAADILVGETLLTTERRGSWRFRLLEAIGAFGLQHRWMYDRQSLTTRLRAAGFEPLQANDTPSRKFRAGDGSVHVVARKGPIE